MDRLSDEANHKPERFPKSEHIEPGSDGWLSPRGGYYRVGSTEHDESSTYLVGNSNEVKQEEKNRFRYPHQREEYDNKNSREKLKEMGWILIRGNILRSEDSLNYTSEQLKAISDAGIKVVSAFDGSTEYSSDEIQGLIKGIESRLAKSEVIREVRKGLDEGKFSPWFTPIREKTVQRIEEFARDPFHTTITTDEVYDYKEPGEHEVLPMEILNILSEGYSEEMKMVLGRSEYTYRVLDLKTGARVWVVREQYFHDGLSGGMMGDYNNYISMYVADEVLVKGELAKLIKNRSDMYGRPPEITYSVNGGYFDKILSGLIHH